jgi:predicted DsbA family dithiol-disulfide isomerase
MNRGASGPITTCSSPTLRRLTLNNVKAYVQEVGLDVATFEQRFSSGKYQTAVQKDIEEGTYAGVTGTPAFFINGRLLAGSQPLAAFVNVIEEELVRAR